MRILYITFNDPSTTPGVYKKELGFCHAMYNACREAGIEFKGLDVFMSTSAANNMNLSRNVEYFQLKKVDDNLYRIFAKIKLIRAFFRIKPVFAAAYEEIRKFNPHAVIFRYNVTMIPAPFNPKKINQNLLFLSEHQSKEEDELRLNLLDYIILPFEKMKAYQFFKNVNAIVGVTTEIAKHEVKKANKKIPYFVLANGIEVEKYPVKDYLEFDGRFLKMLFIASTTARWHGLDRLLHGMANYKGNVKIELNLIGSVTQEIKDLIKSLDLESNIILHGIKYGKKLDKIFDRAHIAVGTLGIHRENLKYGSTLKVREYMARGIPFVISYIDEDIEPGFPLCLNLQSNNDPLDIDEVIKFAGKIYTDYEQKIPFMMRSYALKKMDYKVKAKSFLKFMLDLMNS